MYQRVKPLVELMYQRVCVWAPSILILCIPGQQESRTLLLRSSVLISLSFTSNNLIFHLIPLLIPPPLTSLLLLLLLHFHLNLNSNDKLLLPLCAGLISHRSPSCEGADSLCLCLTLISREVMSWIILLPVREMNETMIGACVRDKSRYRAAAS